MGGFSTQLWAIDRSFRQKLKLMNIINQVDLRDVYKTFYPNKKNVFSSQHLWELSPKLTTHSNKAIFSKYKKTEIIPYILSYYHE